MSVAPVNDPPELPLAPGRVLRLVKRTRIALTPDLLTAVDPDNTPQDLVYHILNNNKHNASANQDDEGESYVQDPLLYRAI